MEDVILRRNRRICSYTHTCRQYPLKPEMMERVILSEAKSLP